VSGSATEVTALPTLLMVEPVQYRQNKLAGLGVLVGVTSAVIGRWSVGPTPDTEQPRTATETRAADIEPHDEDRAQLWPTVSRPRTLTR
jgi:hypothetical protein